MKKVMAMILAIGFAGVLAVNAGAEEKGGGFSFNYNHGGHHGNSWGIGVGFSGGGYYPGYSSYSSYYTPASTYYTAAPTYYNPAPVYYTAPSYYTPAPVYTAPAVVYGNYLSNCYPAPTYYGSWGYSSYYRPHLGSGWSHQGSYGGHNWRPNYSGGHNYPSGHGNYSGGHGNYSGGQNYYGGNRPNWR